MSKFTQEQLETAYRQMQDERDEESQEASIAAEWIKLQLGMGHVKCMPANGCPLGVTPYKNNFVILCVDGPRLEDWTDKLNTMPWAAGASDYTTDLDSWLHGLKLNTPIYEVTTPHGVYQLTFKASHSC